ncbi:gem-associated protein 6-like [Daphnia carinata]|uniref:gem-associated protein 6-like n=1 Tax=Daphnia carinata TaxID=120202 RepID=UPI00257EB720|nr:gem-associated protein 6-like [Daphnia carinata]
MVKLHRCSHHNSLKMDLAEGYVLQYPIEKCPANYVNLVGSRVEVLTINHTKFVGQIYSMDPISGSLFMMIDRCNQEERSIKLIIGNSIKYLKVIKMTTTDTRTLPEENGLQGPSSQHSEDWKQLKDALKKWFHESRIPVNENNYGCLLVLNEIVVGPPYRPENCSGTNEVMLWRVQKLLENFYQK